MVFRPAAVIFPILLIHYDKKITLIVVGAVLTIFFIWDVVRLVHSGVNLFFFTKKKGIFKENEQKRFSTITLFLLSFLLIIIIFSKPIAITAAVFLIFGDMFAKFFGIQYGRIKFFNKSLEGSIAFFVACFASGYFLLDYFPEVSIMMILGGVISATLSELLPLRVDDNLLVGIISATTMYLIQGLV